MEQEGRPGTDGPDMGAPAQLRYVGQRQERKERKKNNEKECLAYADRCQFASGLSLVAREWILSAGSAYVPLALLERVPLAREARDVLEGATQDLGGPHHPGTWP